jgi:hypothetical protein
MGIGPVLGSALRGPYSSKSPPPCAFTLHKSDKCVYAFNVVTKFHHPIGVTFALPLGEIFCVGREICQR